MKRYLESLSANVYINFYDLYFHKTMIFVSQLQKLQKDRVSQPKQSHKAVL